MRIGEINAQGRVRGRRCTSEGRGNIQGRSGEEDENVRV